jgi:hypothetical protein
MLALLLGIAFFSSPLRMIAALVWLAYSSSSPPQLSRARDSRSPQIRPILDGAYVQSIPVISPPNICPSPVALFFAHMVASTRSSAQLGRAAHQIVASLLI